MIDAKGTQHTVCQACSVLAHEQLVQVRSLTSYYVHGAFALTREVSIKGGLWLPTDYLVTSTGAARTNGGLLWHARVQNIDQGVTLAACLFPTDALAFCPSKGPGSTANLSPSWYQFVSGRWTHDIPKQPGLYPIRGARPPVYLHTVSVALRKDGPVILGENDGEITPNIFTSAMWIWSAPMPRLGGLPEDN